jgi:hypothetical protein
MFVMCDMCGSVPKNTYKNGFKRDRVVCDKGLGKIKLFLDRPCYLDCILMGYTSDPSFGYILLETDTGFWHYCSLKCLNYKYPLQILVKGMSDYDKYDILAQLEKENKDKPKQIKKIENDDILLYKDPVEILKNENKWLQEQLQEFQAKQKEIIQNIQCDEDKLKETIERKKQKEVDKLTDALKEREKTIFQMQCRMIELETRIKN